MQTVSINHIVLFLHRDVVLSLCGQKEISQKIKNIYLLFKVQFQWLEKCDTDGFFSKN